MRFLVVKVSSMGDVVHALPVAHDLKRAHPGCRIDWVVEEAFADLVRANPLVDDVIPVAMRRWLKRPLDRASWRGLSAFRRTLRERRYDAVFELQGLFKTAWIARQARGPSYGFDRAAAKEPLSALLINHPLPVDTRQHITEQLRSIPAQALGYKVEGEPVYQWNFDTQRSEWSLPNNAVVLFHVTAGAHKQWAKDDWKRLAKGIVARGMTPVCQGISAEEIALAREIAESAPGSVVAPRLSISQWGKLLPHAQAVVGLDTGLSHLAAAQGVPTVLMFGATPAWRLAPYWGDRHVTLGEPGRWPNAQEVLNALRDIVPVLEPQVALQPVQPPDVEPVALQPADASHTEAVALQPDQAPPAAISGEQPIPPEDSAKLR